MVLADSLRRCSWPVIGFLDVDPALHGRQIAGLPVLGGDDRLADYPAGATTLVNGIGSIDVPRRRQGVYERLAEAGYKFCSVVDPAAFVAGDVEIGNGVQIMAGAMVQTGARLGSNVLVNTGAIVEHDCRIDEHCHIATGVRLSGGVTMGAGCHVGTSATVIQGVRIGSGALIAAGAVVIRDVARGERVRGVPARSF